MPTILMSRVSSETFEPKQLWERLMLERGFPSSPIGLKDAYTASPATLPDDVSGPAAPVGKGDESLAIIRIVNKAGRRVGPSGKDFFCASSRQKVRRSGSVEEAGLRSRDAQRRMIVVVDTPVCRPCTSMLLAWAKLARRAAIDAYVPGQQSMTSAAMASPKTTAQIAAMSGGPELHLRIQGPEVASIAQTIRLWIPSHSGRRPKHGEQWPDDARLPPGGAARPAPGTGMSRDWGSFLVCLRHGRVVFDSYVSVTARTPNVMLGSREAVSGERPTSDMSG